MKFLGEKEVTVNFLGEKEVTMKFLGENEVIVKFLGEKKITINFLGEKEVIVKLTNEDPFPIATSINIAATNSRAMLNAKKAGRLSPSVRVRKVWIPKQYLTYKNDLAIKGKVSIVREWKRMEGIHTIHLKTQNMRKKTSSLRKRMFLQKRNMFLQGKRP